MPVNLRTRNIFNPFFASPTKFSAIQAKTIPADAVSVYLTSITHRSPDDTDDINVFLQYRSLSSTSYDSPFETSRAHGFNFLVKQSVHSTVSTAHTNGQRIFGARFVDLAKSKETENLFEKGQSVVRGFHDKKRGTLTRATTVQRLCVFYFASVLWKMISNSLPT